MNECCRWCGGWDSSVVNDKDNAQVRAKANHRHINHLCVTEQKWPLSSFRRIFPEFLCLCPCACCPAPPPWHIAVLLWATSWQLGLKNSHQQPAPGGFVGLWKLPLALLLGSHAFLALCGFPSVMAGLMANTANYTMQADTLSGVNKWVD